MHEDLNVQPGFRHASRSPGSDQRQKLIDLRKQPLKFFWNIVIAVQAMAACKDVADQRTNQCVQTGQTTWQTNKKGFSILLQDEKTRGTT